MRLRLKALVLATTLVLSACAQAPTATPTPTSSPTQSENVEVNPFVGEGKTLKPNDANFKLLLGAIVETCNREISDGVVGSVLSSNGNLEKRFMVMPAKNLDDHNQWYNQIQMTNGTWELGYFGDGDPLCSEADWAADFLKAPAERKYSKLMQENKAVDFGGGYFSLAIHRGSSELNPFYYLIENGLVTRYGFGNWAEAPLLTLGISSADRDVYAKALKDGGMENAHFTGEIWGLTEADARQIIEGAGLEFNVAMIDSAAVDGAPTDHNPNRINVNLIDGKVAGAWID